MTRVGIRVIDYSQTSILEIHQKLYTNKENKT